MRRWKKRPDGSNWGEFGEDDQIGRLNLLTPEKVRQGLAEVVEGRAFCLSLPLDYPGGRVLAPHRFPPRIEPTLRNGVRYFNLPFDQLGPYCDCGCDDAVTLATQYSTQWDSFAHIGQLFDADDDGVPERVYYNGFRAERDVIDPAAREDARTALGVEHMAVTCVQGRGVLVDLDAQFGRARRVVGHDDLQAAMNAQDVVVEPGDILLLHTGFADVVLSMNRNPDGKRLAESCCALDGTDRRLLDWITTSGVAAIAADNFAVEQLPARQRDGTAPLLPLHNHCLFKLGVPLGELWWLTELARHLRAQGRSRFLLTAPPLRLPGAVGSPLTPVATV